MSEPDVQHAVRVAIERNNRLKQKQLTDVSEIASNAVRLMQRQAEGQSVKLTCLTSMVNNRMVDVDQFEQVLVNVIKNALEACEAGNQVEVISDVTALLIRDNGQPIPDATAANLFDPFYSTKPEGQGIGLTVTREILLNHGFTFSLQTKPDGWTEFRIEFAQEPGML